jgi:uncharacterized membrane protein
MSSTTKRGRAAVKSSYYRVVYALIISNGVSLFLSVMRIIDAQNTRYLFLAWNLFLAWMPLAFAWWLVQRLKVSPWMSWQNIGLTLLWLVFLPNSFYLLSDLIHVNDTGEVSHLYDVVMLCSFIFNAYFVGYLSLFLVHRELLKRMIYERAHLLIAGVFLACSFAIYLGRTLRWNSWDLAANPFGILFDVSEGFVNPTSHPESVVTTGIFFLLLSSTYLVVWELVRALRSDNR